VHSDIPPNGHPARRLGCLTLLANDQLTSVVLVKPTYENENSPLDWKLTGVRAGSWQC
jgi:hypothetical protein